MNKTSDKTDMVSSVWNQKNVDTGLDKQVGNYTIYRLSWGKYRMLWAATGHREKEKLTKELKLQLKSKGCKV